MLLSRPCPRSRRYVRGPLEVVTQPSVTLYPTSPASTACLWATLTWPRPQPQNPESYTQSATAGGPAVAVHRWPCPGWRGVAVAVAVGSPCLVKHTRPVDPKFDARVARVQEPQVGRRNVVPVDGLTPYSARESHGASRFHWSVHSAPARKHTGGAGPITSITNTADIFLTVAVRPPLLSPRLSPHPSHTP